MGPSSPRCHCPSGRLCHQTKPHSAPLPGRGPRVAVVALLSGVGALSSVGGSLRSAPRLSTPASGRQSWEDCEVPAQGRLLQMPAPTGLVLTWCPFPQQQEESCRGHNPWGAPPAIQHQEHGFGLLRGFWNAALEVCRSRCSKAASHVSGQRDSGHLLSGSLWSDALLVPGEGQGSREGIGPVGSMVSWSEACSVQGVWYPLGAVQAMSALVKCE